MSQPAEKMPPPAFDTHKTVKNLKAAGFTERMAEALVNAIHSAISSAMANVATHDDLEKLELRLTIKFGAMLFALFVALLGAGVVIARLLVTAPPL